MKLSQLIKELQVRQKTLKCDPDIVIDHEGENGWYDLEKVGVVDDGLELLVNLKSSNEA